MDHTASTASESRFCDDVARLSRVLGHADRVDPFRAYCTGLLLPGARKSVEPMAAHQSLHHFVAKAGWCDAALLACVRAQVLPVIEAREPISAWPPHHASRCIAAYRFLVGERGRFPFEPRDRRLGPSPSVPEVPRPRGAPDPTRAARA